MTKPGALPALEEVKKWIDYDPQTGLFTWRKSSGSKKAGSEAGGVDAYGYRRIRIGRTKYQAQRLAWLIATGQDPEDFHVDHIDSNPSNNAIANLRLATHSQNACNRAAPATNTSGYKGVTWKKSKNKWNAQIMINYKKKNLGYFNTPEEAYAAYCNAASELHKDFAKTK